MGKGGQVRQEYERRQAPWREFAIKAQDVAIRSWGAARASSIPRVAKVEGPVALLGDKAECDPNTLCDWMWAEIPARLRVEGNDPNLVRTAIVFTVTTGKASDRFTCGGGPGSPPGNPVYHHEWYLTIIDVKAWKVLDAVHGISDDFTGDCRPRYPERRRYLSALKPP